jgi:hypothetical protein
LVATVVKGLLDLPDIAASAIDGVVHFMAGQILL